MDEMFSLREGLNVDMSQLSLEGAQKLEFERQKEMTANHQERYGEEIDVSRQEHLKGNSLQVSFPSKAKPPYALRFPYKNAGAFG